MIILENVNVLKNQLKEIAGLLNESLASLNEFKSKVKVEYKKDGKVPYIEDFDKITEKNKTILKELNELFYEV